MRIALIIPALDEEASLPLLLPEIPRAGEGWELDEVVVADNGSTDRTAEVARSFGARVVHEPERGYGAACLRAIAALSEEGHEPPDAVAFMNADRSEFPEELPRVLEPIVRGEADLVIGSRVLGGVDPRTMTGLQRFGNWLSTRLMRLVWRERFTDLGPFRAIRFESLQALGMRDRNFGWTVEMQIRACKRRLRCTEVPVGHRSRTEGEQKVTGSLSSSLRAGFKILWTILRHALSKR
jgi:glycosyltransferase involved in cell wall biosynthesis